MIKPIMMTISGLLMFSTVTLANTCPINFPASGEDYLRCMELLDEALDSNKAKNETLVDNLRNQAEAAHQSGQQAKSIRLLRKAMRAAGI